MKFHSIETADLKWKVEDIYRERGVGSGGKLKTGQQLILPVGTTCAVSRTMS